MLTTIIASAVAYVLSLGLSGFVKSFFETEYAGNTAAVAMNVIILFVMSLFIYKNNFVRKLYLAILCLSNFSFSLLFTELLLGVLPFDTSGIFAAICAVAVTILFTLISGLLLFRPFEFFQLREINLFIVGIAFLQFIPFMLSYGMLDFLFTNTPIFARLIFSFVLYVFIFFCIRSEYCAGRFERNRLDEENYETFLSSEASRFSDVLTYIQSTRGVKNSYDSAMDSLIRMIEGGETDKATQYIRNIKVNSGKNPALEVYCDNPYVSSIIAMNALRAEQMGIDFRSHANITGKAMRPSEICTITDELLNMACDEASRKDGKKRIKYTIVPTNEALTFEVAYSSVSTPEAEKFSLKNKRLADVLNYLFEEREAQQKYPSLKVTQDIVRRYSGRFSIANAEGSVILSITINC